MIKKIITLLIIFLGANQTFAFENYLITTEKIIKKITVSDESIISATPIFTIDNEKNIIVLEAKKIGTATITIITDETEKIQVKVSENKTSITPCVGYIYEVIDTPPEPIQEIDAPPILRDKQWTK